MNQKDLLIGPPPKKASEVREIALQPPQYQSIGDVTSEMLGKVSLQVAKNYQMQANREVMAGFDTRVGPELDTLKRNAIGSGDYASYRNSARETLEKYFAEMRNKGAFYKTAVDNIKLHKESQLAMDITNFETSTIRAVEEEKLRSVLNTKRDIIAQNPTSVFNEIDALDIFQGNIATIARTPEKALEIKNGYKNQFAATAIDSAIDNLSPEEAGAFVSGLSKYLTSSQSDRYKKAIKKKEEQLRKSNETIERFNNIMSGEESISPNDPEATGIIEQVYNTNKNFSAIDIVTRTNYIPKKFVLELESKMLGGGSGAIDAASEIENLSKFGPIVSRQISDNDKVYARRLLSSFRNTGNLEEAMKYASNAQTLTKQEQTLRMDNAEIREALNMDIKDIVSPNTSNIQFVGENYDYNNVQIRSEYQERLLYYYLNTNMSVSAATESAKKFIKDSYGYTKFAYNSGWFWGREKTGEVLTKLPIEENNGAPKDEENKDWFLIQYKMLRKGYITGDGQLIPGKKIKREDLKLSKEDYQNVAFIWNGEQVGNGRDLVIPRYNIMTVDVGWGGWGQVRSTSILENENGEPITFTPNYSLYKKIIEQSGIDK